MADVTIKYNGSSVAELNGTGSKTLKTSGKYCEGNIEVAYAPRSKTYEITLAKASGWVLLTTLDDEVLSHINDESLIVSLVNISPYAYVWYTGNMYIVTNRILGYSSASLPTYGMSSREQNETNTAVGHIRAPANNTSTAESTTNSYATFRITDGKYYIKPGDGFIKAGTYRLTFAW